MTEELTPLEQQDILDNKKMTWALLVGIVILLGGFYIYLSVISTPSPARESKTKEATRIFTVKNWKDASRSEQLKTAEYYVQQHKDKLKNANEMRITHNINMMQCIEQSVIGNTVKPRLFRAGI